MSTSAYAVRHYVHTLARDPQALHGSFRLRGGPTMEWLPVWWMHWLALGRSPARWDRGHDEAAPATRTPFRPVPELNTVNLRLMELTYRFVAAHSHCIRCGNALGPDLRVIHSVAEHQPWTASIVVSCRGWRRHRHVATAVEATDCLELSPFRVADRQIGSGPVAT